MLMIRTSFIIIGLIIGITLITGISSLFFKVITDVSSQTTYPELFSVVIVLFLLFKIYSVSHVKFIEKYYPEEPLDKNNEKGD